MKKVFLVLAILCTVSTTLAQGKLRVNLFQDLKMATVGDDRGNDAFNPNFILGMDMLGNQQDYGYIVVGMDFEYGDLQRLDGKQARKFDFGSQDYKRYTVNAGYTFNRLLYNGNFEFTPKITYGIIQRFSNSAWRSFGATMNLSYSLGNGFRFNALTQFTNRKDKEAVYGDDANYTINGLKTDFSFFLGVSYDIIFGNSTKTTRF